jgi:hypothetical protein
MELKSFDDVLLGCGNAAPVFVTKVSLKVDHNAQSRSALIPATRTKEIDQWLTPRPLNAFSSVPSKMRKSNPNDRRAK